MRTTRIWLPAVLLVAASLVGNGCILLPEIQDRVVELAASGSTSAEFSIPANTAETLPLDLSKVVAIGAGTSLDLKQILDDAGVDVSTVKNVKISKVEYAITNGDTYTGRTVQGDLTVDVGGGVQPLITGFSTQVDAKTPYQTPTLQTAGVNALNSILGQVLTGLKAGGSPTLSATFKLAGSTTPNTDATRYINFHYAVKITVSMVGTVKVSVPN